MANDVQYKYALLEGEPPVKVCIDHKPERALNYICMGCGEKMIPVYQKKHLNWRNYFRHQHSTTGCTKSRYIHTLAENLIKERFDKKEKPFMIAVKTIKECSMLPNCPIGSSNCKIEGETEPINLYDDYDTCTPEKRCIKVDGSEYYVADLLLTNSNKPEIEPFLIEIRVHHEISTPKSESGLKIMEVRFSTDIQKGEKEIEDFCKQDVFDENWNCERWPHGSGKPLKFHNIPPITKKAELEFKKVVRGYFFTSKKWNFQNIPCNKIKTNKPSKNLVCSVNVFPKTGTNLSQVNVWEMLYFYFSKEYKPLKTCQLCLCGEKDSYGCLYCKRYRTMGTPHYPKIYQAEVCNCRVEDREKNKLYYKLINNCTFEKVYEKTEPFDYDEFIPPVYSKPAEETKPIIIDSPEPEPIIQPHQVEEEPKIEIPLQRCIYNKNGEIRVIDISNTDQFKVIDRDNSIYECNINYKNNPGNDIMEKIMYCLFKLLGETPKNPCYMCESYKSCRKNHPTRKYLTGCGSFKINRKMELYYGYLIPNLDLVEIYKNDRKLNPKTLMNMDKYIVNPPLFDNSSVHRVLSFKKFSWP